MNSGPRHVVLVGPPGSGKSEAGRLLASALGTVVTDVDEMIVREEGVPITRIFEIEGEPAFREKERRTVDQALAAPPHVVVPGGGWSAQPGAMEAARGGGAYRIHLRTSPASAADRLGGDASRPLVGDRPLESLEVLIVERQPYYELADAEVDTDGHTVEVVVSALTRLARAEAGWG